MNPGWPMYMYVNPIRPLVESNKSSCQPPLRTQLSKKDNINLIVRNADCFCYFIFISRLKLRNKSIFFLLILTSHELLLFYDPREETFNQACRSSR